MAGNQRNISVLLTGNNTQLKQSLIQSSAAVKAFDRDIEASNKRLMTTGKLMAGGLAVGAVAAGAGLLYATTKAVGFEKAMRNVNSLTGFSEKQLSALNTQVLELSKTLPQSAEQLAEGLYDIASSGFTGADGMKVLEASAVGASAGLSSTATAAKAITAVLNAYGREASDAADVNDVLFQTVNLGVVTFDELAGSIGDVVGIAAPLGIEIEELGSAIATMTTQGVSGSESTTLLTNLFTKMLRPSENLAEHMRTLGYESGEAMLQANGLRGTIDLLRESTDGSASSWMELFPDIQAARGALALAANDGENYAKAALKIEDAEARRGAAQRTLNEQMKSVSAQMSVAKNQMDAWAISIGLKVLPGVINLIDGTKELAGAIKDNLGEVIQALAPTWANLAEIFADVWEVLVELGQVVGPVVAAMGKLAVGGVVVSLNILTEILGTLTGLLAENEELATVLAIALGIHLLGGVAGLAAKIQTALVLSLINAIGALGTATGAVMRLNAAMLTTIATTTAWAGLFAAALFAWKGYKDGIDAAADAQGRFHESFDSGDLDQQRQAIQGYREDVDAMTARFEELDNRGLIEGIFDIQGSYEQLGLKKSLGAAMEDVDKYERELIDLTESVRRFEIEQSGMSDLEGFNKFGSAAQGAQLLADKMDILVAAGVQVGDTQTTINNKLELWARRQKVGADATPELVDALADLEGGLVDTEEAVDNLKEALDALVGVFLGAASAEIEFEAALDDLADVTKESTSSLDVNTEAGRKNRSAIIDATQSLTDQIVAMAESGATSEEMSTKLLTGRDAIIEAGKAAGFTDEAMNYLLDTYGLTPALVETIVREVGAGATQAAVEGVIEKAGELEKIDPIVRISVIGTAAAELEMQRVEKAIRGVTNIGGVQVVIPPIKARIPEGDGPGGGGPVLARIRASLPPGLRVTSTYRTPAQNAAAGGSPTSYHMDRKNPAVDIGGPTPLLDQYHNTLRRMGGWRELLWRVKGHYDHIHAAARGGPIRGAGTTTSDSIPAWLSNDEHVWTASEVKAAGGHSAVEHLRATVSGKAISRASGGPVNPVPAGTSLSTFVRSYDSPEGIRGIVEDWERYNYLVDQVRQRTALLAEVTAKVEGSAERLADFDRAAQIDAERYAVQQYVEQLERQYELEEKQKQNLNEQMDNQFALGMYDAEWYLVNLEQRMAAEMRFSSEWTSLYRQRTEILEKAAEQEIAIERNRHEMGLVSDDRYIKRLNERLAAEKEYTDEWMALQRERQQIIDRLESDQEATLDKLNGMLRQEADIRKRMADAQIDRDRRVAAANKAAQESIDQLIKSRREQILDWMNLDARMESRGSGFAITSDDEASARSALRAAGLLTEAMQAWTDSQAGGPMSASELILNAREQTKLINEWTAGLKQLRARGLSDEVIDALGLGDSPEALEQVRAFSSATQAEIAALNAAVLERTKAANVQVSREQGQTFTELGHALADIRLKLNEEIEAANTDLREELAEATTALSEIGKEQGLSYAEAIAAGMRSGIPAIRAAAEEARKAMQALNAGQAAANAPVIPPAPTSGAGAPGQAAPGAPPKGTAGSFMLNGQMVHVNTAGIIDTPGPWYGKYPMQVMGSPSSPGMAAPGAPPKGTSGSFQLNGQTVHVNTAGIIDTPGPWYGKYPMQVIQSGTFDRGGILPAGSTILATNRTGDDEFILRKAQLAVFGQLAAQFYGGTRSESRPVNVEYNVDARGAVEGTAKLITDALEEHTEALLRVVGSGVS